MRKDDLCINQSLCGHSVKLSISANVELFHTIGRDMLLNSIVQW